MVLIRRFASEMIQLERNKKVTRYRQLRGKDAKLSTLVGYLLSSRLNLHLQ